MQDKTFVDSNIFLYAFSDLDARWTDHRKQTKNIKSIQMTKQPKETN